MVAPRRIRKIVASILQAAASLIGSIGRSYKFNAAKNSCYINTIHF